MNWTTIQSAIRTWVLTATGLNQSQVIWAKQGGPMPTTPRVDLALRGPRAVGAVDAWDVDYDPGAAWQAAHAYVVGDRVLNGTDSYVCITAGISAASGGPTGTGLDITDGTVHWRCASDEELVYTVSGLRALVLSVRVFTDEVEGNSQAAALLAKVQTGARLPNVTDAFVTAGLALFDVGLGADLSALKNVEIEGRAQAEFGFYVTDEITQRVGRIERAQGTGTINGGEHTVTLETP